MIGIYRTKTGETIEREFDGPVPDEIGGARLVKMRTGGIRRRAEVPFGIKRPVGSITSQAFMENEGRGVPGMEAPAYDRDGNPCFETERQAKDFAQKHGMHYGERGGSHPRWF